MTERDIEIFLTIIEKKNLSKAASALFMSPSSLAYHLGQLEKELNVTLFSRRKGQQNVELTPAGRSFIGLAERWSALYAETGMLQRLDQSRPFYIGGVPSLLHAQSSAARICFPKQIPIQPSEGRPRWEVRLLRLARLFF